MSSNVDVAGAPMAIAALIGSPWLLAGCACVLAATTMHAASRACAAMENAATTRVHAPEHGARPGGACRGVPRRGTQFLAPQEPNPVEPSEVERTLRYVQPILMMTCES
jgi:hypothetical protein